MVDIEPKPSGFRSMFGFGRNKSGRNKTEGSRKLRKKNAGQVEDDCTKPNHRDNPRIPGKASFNTPDARRSSSISSSFSRTSSIFVPWRSNTQYRSQSVSSIPAIPAIPAIPSQRGPRKLSKAKSTATIRAQERHVLDKDTGERKDLTEMMHAFTFKEHTEDEEEIMHLEEWEYDPTGTDGATLLSKLCPELWGLVEDYLTPLDIANLASTCRAMYGRLGEVSYELLRNPLHMSHRLDFLLAMDEKLPNHLFCFPCAQWHVRIAPGIEKLKQPKVLNPVFNCPNSTNNLLRPPRIRISDYRELPFTFVQLYKRAWEHGPQYGVDVHSLARRWKDAESEWTHDTMFHINKYGHVMMRVKSQVFVDGGLQPAAKRMLLYSRNDYTPYFSVCSHWRKGILTSLPKCALDHIPVHEVHVYRDAVNKLRGAKVNGPTQLCTFCRPMRRCADCPTEYLFELKLVEDKRVQKMGPERFRQVLLVTRWSDLGPARSPHDPEWASIVGKYDQYDSFKEIGNRAVSGVFESAFTDTTPRQRILSLNPDNLEENEERGDWY